MKRIIAFTLVLVLGVCLLAGCAGSAARDINACYERSHPDKIVVVSTQAFADKVLENTTTLVRGTLKNGSAAATMVVEGEKMRTVEDGSGEIVYGPIEEIDIKKMYVEGQGVYENGAWDADATSFFPAKGELSLNLQASAMRSVKRDGNAYSFVIPAGKTANIFGEGAEIASDVAVEIVTDGAFVTNVNMSWIVPINLSTGVDQTTVTISTTYYYDLQTNISMVV